MGDGKAHFPCPNCAKTFGQKHRLKRHMHDGVCTRPAKAACRREPQGVLEGGGRTNFNLHRRMTRAATPFLEYTRALAALQSQCESGPVDFIPLGGAHVPRDVWTLAKCIKVAMAREGVLASSPRVVAASAIVCLGLTDRWAAMVGLPPPDLTDPSYFEDLEAKLLIEWALQRPVFNVSVLATNCNTLTSIDSRASARKRISKFVDMARGIANRAPAVADYLHRSLVNDALKATCGNGIPAGGYIMKMTLSLWCKLGTCTLEDFSGVEYPIGSSPVAALSHFIGQEIHGDMALARKSLQWLKELIQQNWESSPPVVAALVFHELHLQSVLCSWWANGRPSDPASATFPAMKSTLLDSPVLDHN